MVAGRGGAGKGHVAVVVGGGMEGCGERGKFCCGGRRLVQVGEMGK